MTFTVKNLYAKLLNYLNIMKTWNLIIYIILILCLFCAITDSFCQSIKTYQYTTGITNGNNENKNEITFSILMPDSLDNAALLSFQVSGIANLTSNVSNQSVPYPAKVFCSMYDLELSPEPFTFYEFPIIEFNSGGLALPKHILCTSSEDTWRGDMKLHGGHTYMIQAVIQPFVVPDNHTSEYVASITWQVLK